MPPLPQVARAAATAALPNTVIPHMHLFSSTCSNNKAMGKNQTHKVGQEKQDVLSCWCLRATTKRAGRVLRTHDFPLTAQ